MTDYSDGMTLGQAKVLLQQNIEDGEHCPCCGQFAKVYKRQIHSKMAMHMVLAYKRVRGEWFHAPTTIPESPGGDDAKLVYWGLIEPHPGERNDGSTRTGWWRVTDRGRLWALNLLAVPKYAYIYDGELLKVEGPPIKVKDALGKKFDYTELMNS